MEIEYYENCPSSPRVKTSPTSKPVVKRERESEIGEGLTIAQENPPA